MVLPIALLVVGSVFIIAGFTGRTITQVINGEAPTPEPDDGGYSGGTSSSDSSGYGDTNPNDNYGGVGRGSDTTDSISGKGGLPRAITRTRPVMIDGKLVAGWLAEIVAFAKMNGWNGTVTSGIRDDAAQRRACIGVCGNPNGCPGTCAPPGQSNHRGKVFPLGAVDVSDPAGFWRAIQKYPGGPPVKNALGAADPVHFSRSGK